MNSKKKINWSFILLFVLFLGCLAYLLLANAGSNGDLITIDKAYEYLDEGKITDVYAYETTVKILVNDKEEVKDFPNNAHYYFNTTTSEIENFIQAVREKNAEAGAIVSIKITYEPTGISFWDIFMPILYIGFGLIILVLIFKMFSNSNKSAMNFGKSRARAVSNIKVKFSDVAGADEEKEELAEIVEFLKNPQKFTDLGARIPKGVLLVGNPGTGKTLLARAIAGESNVPFLSITGSDFVEMFVGVGAARVRDLFEQAKKLSPCIVFIDEIDAVGRQRGTGLGGGNDEREQTLNQLLVEMDGFEANEGIIVLAATNRADVLDPALLRPGRFDRQIFVHLPDVRGREGIIKIHARNKPIDKDVDFNVLARITSGFTGADIENMLNEAAILAARDNRPTILMTDLTEGINKVLMGPQKKSLLITEKDKMITAYHESGHAILGKKLSHCEEVQEVSIIPRGMAAGYTMSRPDNDDNHMTYNKLMDNIAMMMGGRIAEEIMVKDISTGASNDIERATQIARKMVTEWGMSDKIGFANYSSSSQPFIGRDYQTRVDYSEKMAAEIDNEIHNILNKNYLRAKKILTENKDLLEKMAQLLLKTETLYKNEVDMLMNGESQEAIIKHLEDQEKKRKERENECRKEIELFRKIKEIDNKIKTGEQYLRAGILSQDDYNKLLSERNRLKELLEKEKEGHETKIEEKPVEEKAVEKVRKPRTVKPKTETAEKTEKANKEEKPKKKVTKVSEEKKSAKKDKGEK